MDSVLAKTPAELAAPTTGASALFRQATDVAHVCKEIVLKCVIEIAGRRYLKVEGWMSIAVGHGCIASIRSVENIPGEGVKSVAEVRRISDQAVLAMAEGYVGVDEPDWYGGKITRLNRRRNPPVEMEMILPKRSDHAIRAMAQTRAISRVLRAGFSHVVVLIDEGLSTVPYEEISEGDDDLPMTPPASKDKKDTAEKKETAEGAAPEGKEKKAPEVPRDDVIAFREQFREKKWENVTIHFGQKKDTKLGELEPKNLTWWVNQWHPKQFGKKPIPEADLLLRAALDVAGEETAAETKK